MKIFRGPRTAKRWQATDERPLKTWARSWQPGNAIQFDGTIQKFGERHTDLGVELTEEDLNDLVLGLLKYYRDDNRRLRKERDQLATTVGQLEGALGKLSNLASFMKDRAPSNDDLLKAMELICDHFRWSHRRSKPFRPGMRWLKWKTL